MNNKVLLSVVTPVVILGAVAAGWRYIISPSVEVESTPDRTVENRSVNRQELMAMAPAEMDRQEAAKLLSDPRVEAYLRKERDKLSLDDYFNGNDDTLSDQEIWQLIETIEAEGRVMAYEALALKLAWLERNSADKAAFEQAAAELVEAYREKSQRHTAEYDPYKEVPGFAEYKQREVEIVKEVQQMTSFPDGMSRQEYLRQRLQEARKKAYSDQGSQ
ncbi:hypothetical protein [Microbulbifer discodermiae]|uniref:hypothetical protein n=1 Tax=Microbulbifer sp. 2201CG32-9 TaxID=3232309 RepID=UPI00345B7B42